MASNFKKTVSAVPDIIGSSARIIANTLQAGEYAAQNLRDFFDAARPASVHLGRGVTEAARFVENTGKFTNVIAETLTQLFKLVTAPVNRLLNVTENLIHKGFDKIDAFLAPVDLKPVELPEPEDDEEEKPKQPFFPESRLSAPAAIPA